MEFLRNSRDGTINAMTRKLHTMRTDFQEIRNNCVQKPEDSYVA